jgi:hypothetical protein
MMASPHPLVPKDKLDIETAQFAMRAGFPAVEPVLYELLEWIQDCNWPVGRELFPFLASIGEPLAPHIRRVFESDDYIWQYWICCLFQESPALYSIFREDIHRIASSPTTDERTNELDERCAAVIAHYEPSTPNDSTA